MSDRLADLNMRLGQLLRRIMKETDPAKFDELGAESGEFLVKLNVSQLHRSYQRRRNVGKRIRAPLYDRNAPQR